MLIRARFFGTATAFLFLCLPGFAFAGSVAYTSPGLYEFIVPEYGALTVHVYGAGGGGGGEYDFPGGGSYPGSSGGDTSIASLMLYGYGGHGGGTVRYNTYWYYEGVFAPDGGSTIGYDQNGSDGASGTGSGGDTNTTGGGAAGGSAWYVAGYHSGAGGAGGSATKTYSYGASGAPAPGESLGISVGPGGAAAPYAYGGDRPAGSGSSGAVYITWTDPPPASCSVSLSPNPINQGSGSTLSWSTSNADSWVYLNNVGYVGTTGTVSVFPSATTDYSCYAQGSGGSDGWHSAVLTVYQSCTLPWGGSITNGQSTTAYAAGTVPYGSSCMSQTRFCSNDSLSGSYTYGSCSVIPAAPCTLNGTTLQSGESATFYSSDTSGSGQLCSALTQTRTCTDGVLSGSDTYQYASCSCTPTYSCSGDNIRYTNSSCTTTTTTTCTAPSFCSSGSSTCLVSPPTFNSASGLSGHLQIAPSLVRRGSTGTVYWNVGNASCTVSGNGDSWSTSSGAETTSAITQQTSYTLNCTGDDGSTINETQTFNILPVFQEL